MTELPLITFFFVVRAFLQPLVCLAEAAKPGKQDSAPCRVWLAQDSCLAKIPLSWLGFGDGVGGLWGVGSVGASPPHLKAQWGE